MHEHDQEEITEVVANEVGYSDVDWDTLDQADVDTHDAIMESDDPGSFDPEALSDLGRWALAQVVADDGDVDAFIELATLLLDGERQHPALDYAEIALEVADELSLDGNIEAAEAWCQRAEDAGAIPQMVELARAANDLWNRGRERGLKRIQKVVDEAEWDPRLLLRVVDVLFFADETDAAISVMERLAFLADEENDTELAAIVDELYQALEEE